MNREVESEIQRIRAEYRRRDQQILPDYYSWQKPVNFFHHSQLCRTIIRALATHGRYPLTDQHILDVGCGRGNWLLEFLQWGATVDHLHGIDLDEGRVQAAYKKLGGADLRSGDARFLPWESSQFDLVCQFTVFTSILDHGVKQAIAAEMLRVLRPNGLILWYDFQFNNPANDNVRGIKLTEICSLFSGCSVCAHRVTLAPPIARLVVPRSWPAALMFECVPFLRTHYLALIERASPQEPHQ